jgi:hypothetical protein
MTFYVRVFPLVALQKKDGHMMLLVLYDAKMLLTLQEHLRGL